MAQAKRTKQRTARAKKAGLTPRECEVVNLIARGLTGGEIASTLHMGEATVKKHRENLMRKTEVASIAELTHYAIWAGITPLMEF